MNPAQNHSVFCQWSCEGLILKKSCEVVCLRFPDRLTSHDNFCKCICLEFIDENKQIHAPTLSWNIVFFLPSNAFIKHELFSFGKEHWISIKSLSFIMSKCQKWIVNSWDRFLFHNKPWSWHVSWHHISLWILIHLNYEIVTVH